MVQCLQAQGNGGGLGANWNQFSSAGKGSFVPQWSSNNNNPNQGPNDWQRPNNNYNDMNKPRAPPGDPQWGRDGPMGQPQPGVHPDDWGRVNVVPSPETTWTRRGKPADPPPGWSKPDERKRNRQQNQRRMHGNVQNPLETPGGWNNNMQRTPGAPEMPGGPQYDMNGNLIGNMDVQRGRDYIMVEEETAAVSLSRKYGYAILALSVVVLAVLMVIISLEIG